MRIRENEGGKEARAHEDKCRETKRQVERHGKEEKERWVEEKDREAERERKRGSTRRLDNLPSSLRATSWQPEGLSPRRRRTETTWVNLCENLSSCL